MALEEVECIKCGSTWSVDETTPHGPDETCGRCDEVLKKRKDSEAKKEKFLEELPNKLEELEDKVNIILAKFGL